MDESFLAQLSETELRRGEPLARHTTFRIGGPVACLASPESEPALERLVALAKEGRVPFFVLGGGSNLLAPDGPLDRLAVKLDRACGQVRGEAVSGADACRVVAGAGVKLARLLRLSTEKGLGGLECLVGIPGTVGGAVVMNAGTREGCIAEVLDWIEILDAESGVRRHIAAANLSPRYRSMGLPESWIVLAAALRLRSEPREALRSRYRALMTRRKASQPLRWPSAGSVFKNPPGGRSAGELIDRAGLKGLRSGSAEISEKHANWIVNRGGATAEDVLALMARMEEAVLARFDIRLEREIRVIEP